MKPLFHTKFSTRKTASLLIVFSSLFSSEVLANSCSKTDIDYYLQKGFNHEQVTKLCSTPAATTPYQKQAPAQPNSSKDSDQSYLSAALDAEDVTINQNQLSYSSKECAEYGPPNNTDLTEKVCVHSTVTVNFSGLKIKKISNGIFLIRDAQLIVEGNLNRDYLNLHKVRSQDKSEVVRLLPVKPKQVNIPVRRGIDPAKVAQKLRKYIRS